MAGRGHPFHITVTASGSSDQTSPRTLTFDHINHDDIISIAERVRERSGLTPDIAAATAIGLKLLGEAVLKEKRDPLFDPLREPLRAFVQNLKQRVATD